METKDIVRVLDSDKFTKWMVCDVYDGVHAADQLHVPTSRPAAMVINTDPSWKPGRHWVAVYVPVRGPWEYFDSYGEKPNVSFIRQFLKNRSVVYNSKSLQSPASDVCGHYCIYYLVHRSRGHPMDVIVDRFGKDAERNDEDVYDFVRRHFPV